MHRLLDLYNARVSHLNLQTGHARVLFSVAYIHIGRDQPAPDSQPQWSQEVEITLEDTTLDSPRPGIPNTVLDGYVEVDGNRHEFIHVPYKGSGPAILFLQFNDGAVLKVRGNNLHVIPIGRPVNIE